MLVRQSLFSGKFDELSIYLPTLISCMYVCMYVCMYTLEMLFEFNSPYFVVRL